MVTHDYVDGTCYTIKILCSEVSELFVSEQQRLSKYLIKMSSVEKIHIGLKYLAYETDYSDEYMLSLVPEIKEVVDQYLPMDITIKGLGGFWNTPEWPSRTILFLRVELSDKLREFHKNLRGKLKDKVDIFNLAEGDYYTPHITLGVANEAYTDLLKDIVKSSECQTPKPFKVKRFGMRLNGGQTYIIKD